MSKAPDGKIKSILVKLREVIANPQSLEDLKTQALKTIEESRIDALDKMTMKNKIVGKTSLLELQFYLYNCILKYEGKGVIR